MRSLNVKQKPDRLGANYWGDNLPFCQNIRGDISPSSPGIAAHVLSKGTANFGTRCCFVILDFIEFERYGAFFDQDNCCLKAVS